MNEGPHPQNIENISLPATQEYRSDLCVSCACQDTSPDEGKQCMLLKKILQRFLSPAASDQGNSACYHYCCVLG